MAYAYCFQSGEIDFAETLDLVPSGTIVFAKGKRVQTRVAAKARLAYDGHTLLVPGVPEAADDAAAFKAFSAWRKWAFPRGRSL